MAMVNCKRCGNVFIPDKYTNVCPDCVAAETADLKKVNDYLREYPLANVMEVSERTGVNAGRILQFVKAGCLRMIDPPEQYKCRLCGDPVKKGTLCQECRDKVAELNNQKKKKKK